MLPSVARPPWPRRAPASDARGSRPSSTTTGGVLGRRRQEEPRREPARRLGGGNQNDSVHQVRLGRARCPPPPAPRGRPPGGRHAHLWLVGGITAVPASAGRHGRPGNTHMPPKAPRALTGAAAGPRARPDRLAAEQPWRPDVGAAAPGGRGRSVSHGRHPFFQSTIRPDGKTRSGPAGQPLRRPVAAGGGQRRRRRAPDSRAARTRTPPHRPPRPRRPDRGRRSAAGPRRQAGRRPTCASHFVGPASRRRSPKWTVRHPTRTTARVVLVSTTHTPLGPITRWSRLARLPGMRGRGAPPSVGPAAGRAAPRSPSRRPRPAASARRRPGREPATPSRPARRAPRSTTSTAARATGRRRGATAPSPGARPADADDAPPPAPSREPPGTGLSRRLPAALAHTRRINHILGIRPMSLVCWSPCGWQPSATPTWAGPTIPSPPRTASTSGSGTSSGPSKRQWTWPWPRSPTWWCGWATSSTIPAPPTARSGWPSGRWPGSATTGSRPWSSAATTTRPGCPARAARTRPWPTPSRRCTSPTGCPMSASTLPGPGGARRAPDAHGGAALEALAQAAAERSATGHQPAAHPPPHQPGRAPPRRHQRDRGRRRPAAVRPGPARPLPLPHPGGRGHLVRRLDRHLQLRRRPRQAQGHRGTRHRHAACAATSPRQVNAGW